VNTCASCAAAGPVRCCTRALMFWTDAARRCGCRAFWKLREAGGWVGACDPLRGVPFSYLTAGGGARGMAWRLTVIWDGMV
jgi:hypothetical protein